MTRSAAAAPARPTALLLAGLLGALLAGPLAGPEPPAHAAPEPAVAAAPLAAPATGATAGAPPPAAEGPVLVALDELPRVLVAGAPFRLAGRLTATDETPGRLSGLRLRLVRGDRLVSRSQLARAAAAPDPAGRRVLDVPLPGTAAAGDELAYATPDDLGVDDLSLGAIGVYPLTVQVRGRVDGGPRRLLGSVQTFLPWFPEAVDAPTRLVWLWPLVDLPRRGPDRLLRDDALAGSLTPEGRLGGLLEAAIQGRRTPTGPGEIAVPVTLVTDPDLLETARQMKGGYAVAPPGGAAGGGAGAERVEEPGEGTAAAERWLARLAGLVGDDGLVVLPYADPDVSALVRGGAGDLVRDAVRDAAGTAQEVLGVPERRDLAWPPGGVLTREALGLLAAEGARAVVLAEQALPADDEARPPTQPSLAPAGALPGTGAGAPRGLVADAGLSTLLATDPDAYGGDRLAEQRFLVETAMITAERPGVLPRTLLVTPPRRWDVPRLLAQDLLRDTGRVPWLRPATLDQLLDATPSTARGPLAYPDGARQAELDAADVAEIRRLADRLDVLADVLVPAERAEPLLRPVAGALRAGGSSAWRTAPGGAALRRAVADRVGELRDAIGVARPGAPLTLTSSSGEIRVGVVNMLRDVDARVRLELSGSARLVVLDDDAEVRTLPPGYNQVRVRLQSRGPGLVTLQARLVTADGRPVTDAVPIRVRSTAYGRTALAITVAALGVLLVTAGVRIARRGLRGRHAAPDRRTSEEGGPTAPPSSDVRGGGPP